jgi:hypothetical protein
VGVADLQVDRPATEPLPLVRAAAGPGQQVVPGPVGGQRPEVDAAVGRQVEQPVVEVVVHRGGRRDEAVVHALDDPHRTALSGHHADRADSRDGDQRASVRPPHGARRPEPALGQREACHRERRHGEQAQEDEAEAVPVVHRLLRRRHLAGQPVRARGGPDRHRRRGSQDDHGRDELEPPAGRPRASRRRRGRARPTTHG